MRPEDREQLVYVRSKAVPLDDPAVALGCRKFKWPAQPRGSRRIWEPAREETMSPFADEYDGLFRRIRWAKLGSGKRTQRC